MNEDGLEIVALGANLTDEKCMLDHIEERKAVVYIYQSFEGITIKFDLAIPVCEICVARLASDDCLLIYCVDCCSSKWVYKPDSKHKYFIKGERIRWLPYCPNCIKKNKGD